jgi:hypothetical protein
VRGGRQEIALGTVRLFERAVHRREPLIQLSQLTQTALEVRLAHQVEVEKKDPAHADVGATTLSLVGDVTLENLSKKLCHDLHGADHIPLRQTDLYMPMPMRKRSSAYAVS